MSCCWWTRLGGFSVVSCIFVQNVGPSICWINLIAIWKDYNSEVGMIKTEARNEVIEIFLFNYHTIELSWSSQDIVQSVDILYFCKYIDALVEYPMNEFPVCLKLSSQLRLFTTPSSPGARRWWDLCDVICPKSTFGRGFWCMGNCSGGMLRHVLYFMCQEKATFVWQNGHRSIFTKWCPEFRLDIVYM